MAEWIEPLTAAEERALSLAVRSWVEYRDGLGPAPTPAQRRILASLEASGLEARNEMILRAMPTVYRLARKNPWMRRLDDAAVRSVGVLGMIRAAETFDPDRRLRFSAYARHWVRAYMQTECTRLLRPLVRKHATADGYEVAWHAAPQSADGEMPAAASEIAAMLDGCKLTEREREFVRLYFGLDGEPLGHGGAAKAMGLSGTRASQLFAAARKKLRSFARTNARVRVAIADYFGVEPGELPLEAA